MCASRHLIRTWKLEIRLFTADRYHNVIIVPYIHVYCYLFTIKYTKISTNIIHVISECSTVQLYNVYPFHWINSEGIVDEVHMARRCWFWSLKLPWCWMMHVSFSYQESVPSCKGWLVYIDTLARKWSLINSHYITDHVLNN